MRVLPIGASRNGRSKVVPSTCGVQIGARREDAVARAEPDGVEDAAIVAQRDLVLGPTVDVVEDDARQAAPARVSAGRRC
jgi:hypothetical protein